MKLKHGRYSVNLCKCVSSCVDAADASNTTHSIKEVEYPLCLILGFEQILLLKIFSKRLIFVHFLTYGRNVSEVN
jgi:hypothetical protein